MRILVIEDNDTLREATVAMLTNSGHTVTGLVCAEDLDESSFASLPEVFIVDVNLPGEDGMSLARRLRAAQPLAGIIIATVRNDLDDRLAGYECGADIYLPKPVDPAELRAAVDTLGRRLQAHAEASAPGDDGRELRLDSASRKLSGPAGSQDLSRAETDLLVALSRARSRRLENWQLMEVAGEDPQTCTKAALEMRITRLRQKLDAAGARPQPSLRALRGFGYQLEVRVSVF